jgi:hypothetical protein
MNWKDLSSNPDEVLIPVERKNLRFAAKLVWAEKERVERQIVLLKSIDPNKEYKYIQAAFNAASSELAGLNDLYLTLMK